MGQQQDEVWVVELRIRIAFATLMPLLGRVAAGQPVSFEENVKGKRPDPQGMDRRRRDIPRESAAGDSPR